MKKYLYNAIANGCTKGAIEIHTMLVNSGAISPSQTIAIEFARLIMKEVFAEIEDAERDVKIEGGQS